MVTLRDIGMATAGAVLVAAVAGQAQQKARTLTPQDYIDIQQLVAHYPFALDGGLEQGKAFADLFSDDGEFHQQPTAASPAGRVWKGRQELLTIAKRDKDTPDNVGHFIVNHAIDPTPDGAVGKQYLIGGYQYHDVYVKTAAGWRFKSRTVVIAPNGQRNASQPSRGTTPPR
jgi:hypothetical protein